MNQKHYFHNFIIYYINLTFINIPANWCTLFYFLHAVHCNYNQRHGEGSAWGLDLRGQATSLEKENGPLTVCGINGNDVSERRRRK